MKAGTGAGAVTERQKLNWEFWEKFLNRVQTEHPGWTKAKTPTTYGWIDLPSGVGGVAYETVFAQQGLRVQLYFLSADAAANESRFQALHAVKEQFEESLGETATSDDKPARGHA